jgi:hypothetical protein
MRHTNLKAAPLALAATLGVFSLAPAAALAVTVSSPYGSTPTEIVVGRESSSGEIWVAVVASTGQCSITQIGTSSSLFEDTNIIGGSGNDLMTIGAGGQTACGLTFSGTPTWGPHYIDLYGGDGNDTLWTAVSNADSWLFGGAGNDFLVSSSNLRSELYGEDGNDSLFTAGVNTHDEVLDGGNGSDCVFDNNESFRTMTCGPQGSACAGAACSAHAPSCTVETQATICIGWHKQ